MRIALMDDYQGVAAGIVAWDQQLPDAEVVSFGDHVDNPAELVRRLNSFDVVVAMRERTAFDRNLLGSLANLRLLVTTGMRNSAIDIGAAQDLGITVCGTGSSGNGPVELTWGLILCLARHICEEQVSLRAGGWQQTVGFEIAGKQLGIVGLGRLGSRVAAVGSAFGMDVVAWSPNLDPERARAAGARWVSEAELYSASDIVTLHMVLSDRTRGMVGAQELAQMKPTAYLVNTARSGLVDEVALVDAVQSKRIAGAAMDVFEKEPVPPDHPLLRLENTVVTPHLGYVTMTAYHTFYSDALEDIVSFAAGQPVRVLSAG